MVTSLEPARLRGAVQTIKASKERHLQSGIYTIRQGRGTWTSRFSPNPGFYACGAKVQADKGADSNKSYLVSGLELTYCSTVNWYQQQTGIIEETKGDWEGTKMCPQGSFIRRVDTRAEKDSTAAGRFTKLELFCQNPETGAHSSVLLYDAYEIDMCNPGEEVTNFNPSGKWTCPTNLGLRAGAGHKCRGGWEECEIGANPGSEKIINWIKYVCPTNREIVVGERCEDYGAEWVDVRVWKIKQNTPGVGLPPGQFVRTMELQMNDRDKNSAYHGGINGIGCWEKNLYPVLHSLAQVGVGSPLVQVLVWDKA